MKKTLFPPQQVAVDHLLSVIRERGAALNSSDTGTGKTVMAVEMARDLNLEPLVICPKSIIPGWQRTFAEQDVECLGVINYEQVRTGNTIYGHWLNKKAGNFVWNEKIKMLIFDESHRCKSRKGQNAALLRCAKGGGRINLMLSATAAENPSEMKALGHVLGLHSYNNFTVWAKARGCHFDNWGKLKFTESPRKAQEILEELRDELYPDCGYKVTREDMGEYFTRTSILTDPLDFGDGGEIASLYEEMEDPLVELEEKILTDSTNPAAEALVRTLRARQKVELLKVPLLRDMVQEAIAEGQHVAVFLNFNASIVALNDLLGGNCPIVWGTDPRDRKAQSSGARQEVIDSFQENRENIILLNIEAGGVAISLHDERGGAPRLALISPTWNAKSLHQVLGRVDRAGSMTESLQRILFAADTVEDDVREALERKLNNLKTLHTMPNIPVAPPAKKAAPKKKVAIEVVEIEEHAKYNPSSLRFFEICPSYLNRPDDPEDENEAAESGTRIHKALEIEDIDSLEREDEQHLAALMLEAAQELENQHGVGDGELTREIKLDIDLTHFSTFGTLDRLRIKDNIGVAIDYKCGWTPVDEAEINAQGWAYVLGIFQKFKELDTLYFYFLIPRQDMISGAIFTRDKSVKVEGEIAATPDDIHLRINLIIDRAEKLKGKEFNPQPHVCEWCGNKLHCQALANKSLVLAKSKDEDGLPLPDELDVSKLDDPEEIAKYRMLIIPLEKLIEEVKKKANFIGIEEGYDIPGFIKVFKKTSRSISDPVAAYHIAQGYGVTQDEFLACAGKVKIGDLEDAVGKHASQGEKAKKKEEFSDILAEAEVLSGGDHEYGYLRVDRKFKK